MKRRSPVFDVELVGNGEEVELDDGLYTIRPQRYIRQPSSERVMKAMLQMTKLDIAALQRAAL